MRRYYVYIMASRSRVPLDTGVTNDVWRSVWEHKNDVHPGLTSKYGVHRLVYFESFKYNAIPREKRERKVALIRAANPTWESLSETAKT